MNILAIDAHSIGYTQQEAKKGLKTGDQSTSAIFGFAEFLGDMAKENIYDSMSVLWDGKSNWRKDFYPGYKAQRAEDPKTVEMRKEFKSQIKLIREMLMILGVDQFYSASAEADDLATYRKRLAVDAGDKIMFATGDRDWLQLVDASTSWYSPRVKAVVTKASFETYTGYDTPSTYIQGKAFMGDASDNIPGVGGIGEKGAAEVMKQHGNVATFIKDVRRQVEEEPNPKKRKGLPMAYVKFAQNEPSDKEPELGRIDVFRRNLTLMTLRDETYTDLMIIQGAFDEEKVKKFFQTYAFMSLLENFEQYIKPFRSIQTAFS